MILEKILIIPKDVILYHTKAYFIKRTCITCKHLCKHKYMGSYTYGYYTCKLKHGAHNTYLLNKDYRRIGCFNWKVNDNIINCIR